MNNEEKHNYTVGIKEQFLSFFAKLSLEEKILLKYILVKGQCPCIKTSAQRYIFEDDYYSEVRVVLDGKKTPQPIYEVMQKLFNRHLRLVDSNSTITAYLFESFSLDREEGADIILFTLSSVTLYFLQSLESEWLLNSLNQFTVEPLSKIENSYTALLYKLVEELLVDNNTSGVLELDFLALKKKMGVENNVYECTQNFKRRVLMPSIKDIYDLLKISITFQNINEKGGKTIKGYRLIVDSKK